MSDKTGQVYITGVNGQKFPASTPINQKGLKRDIVELVLNLAAPDDDCMLSDFLHALQFVLNKHLDKKIYERQKPTKRV